MNLPLGSLLRGWIFIIAFYLFPILLVLHLLLIK